MDDVNSSVPFLVDEPSTDLHSAVNTSGQTPETEFEVPLGLLVLLSILYGSISLVTVIGNVLVILVVCKNKGMQTVTNFFIANLSVADVMIGILGTPFQFQAALLQRWDLPAFLCPAAPFVKELTVNVSIITLAIISIDRYMAIIYPLKPRWSKKVAVIMMSMVWLFSVLCATPTVLAFRVIMLPGGDEPSKPWCYSNFTLGEVDLAQTYSLYLIVVQYFLPLVVISYAYIRIMYRIWFSKTPGSAVDQRDQVVNRNKKKVSSILV